MREVVGVVGARGGAGATVLAAGLAHALVRRGASTTLVDLVPENGGIDVVLGTEDDPGLRWPHLADARGRLDGTALRERLVRWDGVAVVGATREGPARVPGDAVADVCVALAEASDVTVLDLGRSCLSGHPSFASAALRLCDEVLVVVPLDLPAVAGALVARDELVRAHCRAALVVRRPAPGSLDSLEVGGVVGLDVATEVGWDSRLAAAIERGVGPVPGRGPLARAGSRLAARYVGGGRR